jgi:hypothetical protein
MAKKTKSGESIGGYFRKVFEENPKLLDAPSNESLLQRWLQDHPDQKEVPSNVKSNLANIKSVLRKKRREGTAAQSARPARAIARTANSELETLEEHIDEGLTLAKNIDREGLASVIALLRRARNEVVWKMGQ